jgi:streptogramin lyase
MEKLIKLSYIFIYYLTCIWMRIIMVSRISSTILILLIMMLWILPMMNINASPAKVYSESSDGVVTSNGGINDGAPGFWIGDETNPPNAVIHGFVKFSLAGVTGTLSSARLYLYVEVSAHDSVWDNTSPLVNPGLGDCQIIHIDDYETLDPTDFGASSIGNDPGVLIGSTETPNVGYISIDVTAAMQDDINHGRAFTAFMIKLSTDTDYDGMVDGLTFGSSESGATRAPYIEYSLLSLVGLTEWSLPAGRAPFGIFVDHGEVWYVAGNGMIGKLNPPSNMFVEWSVRTGGAENPASLKVLGFGDIVYFTDRAGNKICKLIPSMDKVSTATVPTSNSGPTGITFPYFFIDSPGSITFTEEWRNKIGRLQLGGLIFDVLLPAARSSTTVTPTFNFITPEIHIVTPTITPGNPNLPPPIASVSPEVSGPFTEWPLSAFMAGSRPMMVIPDETSYWFTTYRNYLGRLVSSTRGDAVYIFNLPTPSASTIDLKLDSAGNIWYTAGNLYPGSSPDIIGKLEPATLTVTEWIVPTTGGTPFSLAIDATGMVWFTELHGNKIGRLDPTTNTIYEFPLPTSNSGPAGLSIDQDGNIWFTEENANKLGGLSPAGKMVPEFPANILVMIIATLMVMLATFCKRPKKETFKN